MTSPRLRSLRSPRLSAVFAALALVAGSVLVAAAPASAHDQLVTSDPAADASVDALPAALTLTFSGALLADDGATEVQVTDASGASLVTGAPQVTDNVVTQAVSGAPSGAVTVLWRVVSSDGHPISGQYAFTVAGSPAPTPTPSATPEQSPASSPSASAPVTAAPVPDTTSSGASDALPWIIAGVIIVAVGGAVLYLLVTRARRARAADAARRPRTGPASDR